MSKIIKNILLSLSAVTALAIGFITFLTDAAMNQSAPDYSQVFLVNAPAGLNVRNENCNIIDTLTHNSAINAWESRDITCNVKGRNYEMVQIHAEPGEHAFIAKVYLEKIVGKASKVAGAPSTVTASIGLNLRDENCNKITAMPYKAKVVSFHKAAQLPAELIVCNVNNTNYALENVNYNGTYGYAANNWLQ